MKELQAQNSRLRKMVVEEKLKAEIASEALASNQFTPQTAENLTQRD